MKEIRAPFLILPVVLTIYGTSIAFFETGGHINWVNTILGGIGLISLHISVNVFNEYYDFKTGIDMLAPKTPFSGGSGVLPAGELKSNQVLFAAILSLLIGIGIGIFLYTRTGWPLLVMGVAGVLIIVLYTSFFAKIMMGELTAGAGLGSLPVLGIYYINACEKLNGIISMDAVIASVPAGLLVFNLLFLNEFPDMEADKKGGRHHIVIVFGKKISGWIYTVFAMGIYAWTIVWVWRGKMPVLALLVFLTFPISLRACIGALRDYNKFEKLLPAQGMNVMVTMLAQIFLAVGYFINT